MAPPPTAADCGSPAVSLLIWLLVALSFAAAASAAEQQYTPTLLHSYADPYYTLDVLQRTLYPAISTDGYFVSSLDFLSGGMLFNSQWYNTSLQLLHLDESGAINLTSDSPPPLINAQSCPTTRPLITGSYRTSASRRRGCGLLRISG